MRDESGGRIDRIVSDLSAVFPGLTEEQTAPLRALVEATTANEAAATNALDLMREALEGRQAQLEGRLTELRAEMRLIHGAQYYNTALDVLLQTGSQTHPANADVPAPAAPTDEPSQPARDDAQ